MRKILAIAITTLLGTSAFAAGEVYRWKDNGGTWHYSDQPQPGAELVRGVRAPGAAPAATNATPEPTAPVTASEAMPVSSEVAQEVRQEAATAKAQQCTKAKAAYEQSVQAVRIYKMDSKGNRVFLTDAEMDATRLEARSARDLACRP